jgi:multidrug efflux pump subunit AcrB
MSHGKSDQQAIRETRNTARYFTENRHVAWVILVGTLLWGVFGYVKMPKRKDPEVQVRSCAVLAAWPGATAEMIEDLLTRPIEEKIAENAKIEKIESNTRGGVAVITITLQEGVKDTGKEFDDIKLKIDTIRNLPHGARPIQFIKDFGDTAALMLTVASPKVGEVELQLRADALRRGIEEVRARPPATTGRRASLAYAFPANLDPKGLRRVVEQLGQYATERKIARDVRFFEGPGFMGLDAEGPADEATIRDGALRFLQDRMRTSELHPDVWRAVVIFDPKDTEDRLGAVVESKYSYRELDEFTDAIKHRLQSVPEVAKVQRSGVLGERIFLDFSQERLASYGIQPAQLSDAIGARNITVPGGVIEVQGKTIGIDPSGALGSDREIGDILAGTSTSGSPVYLRDLVEISRDYESPPSFLNKYTWRDKDGRWQRTRAITLAVSMRSGRQIGEFGQNVDRALDEARRFLPEDLVMARTSDQPRQVGENLDLFMTSLYEAVGLVVLVALLGFWEWRSAVLMALSIPITLMATYGLMYLVGVDVQQVSVASLIIALGLLVDDPVVAGDAIKRDLALGHPPLVAAWLGPTKLARAILFATITNIVAYLPFLMLPGDTGNFIYSLPVVLTASLVASRVVSMTFIPLLGYYLLRPSGQAEPTPHERRNKGFGRVYSRVAGWAIDHRWQVLAASALLVLAGSAGARSLKTAFFPKDLSYLSYVDVWLPEDAPISATNEVVHHVDEVIRGTVEQYGKEHPDEHGKPRDLLRSITTFVGGGGPRFWFSVVPEQQQLNYAQLILEVRDKHETSHLIAPLQRALSAEIPGARIDVRQLESGKAVGAPVAFRISGESIAVLRSLAERARAVLRAAPRAERARDDWGAESFQVKLEIDPDRANMAGVTNLDVATSSAGSMNGNLVGSLREGDRQIPIVARLRAAERAHLSDVENLYVNGSRSGRRVPLRQISSLSYGMITQKILRRNHYRTITVSAFPSSGVLASEVMSEVRAPMAELGRDLPPGYSLEIAGEADEQKKGFGNLAVVLLISVAAIFLALVIQFRSAVKPLIVFAAIPYGVVGALVSLAIMKTAFGFMAFLGIISLIGVIVSHVIVLFDFIEEKHEEGEPLRDALIDAGILRLRPVMITVGATVFALFPLASHGGPLWEPLCYAQIGGLTVATFITLLIVPVLYAIVVLDLKLVKWEREGIAPGGSEVPAAEPAE